jgi:hypothetical protein
MKMTLIGRRRAFSSAALLIVAVTASACDGASAKAPVESVHAASSSSGAGVCINNHCYAICDYSDNCSGLDPNQTLIPNWEQLWHSQGLLYTCASGAWPLQSVTLSGYPYGGSLELFWSNSCGTNWAQTNAYMNNVFLDANVTRSDGAVEDASKTPSQTADSATVVSPMVFAPNSPVHGCGRVSNGYQQCTNWF